MKNKRKIEETNLEFKEEKRTSRKLFNYLLILLAVVALVIGGTYAYFIFTVGTGDVNIQSAEDITLSFTDNKDNMKNDLIPTSRENALIGLLKENDKCVDIYGFSACSLYEFTVSNDSNTSQVINITMTPVENEYQSLEFMLYSGKIEDITEDSIPIIANQELNYNSLTPITFNDLTETILANDDVSYTLVFYILNKDENQVTEDANKKFRANININSITTGQYISEQIDG